MAPVPDWSARAKQLKADIYAIYLAGRDPRVPWYAMLLALLVAAYALSPIDLIPDFIPVVGHLDDLVLVPLGIALTRRLIPAPVWADCRARAVAEGPRGRAGWVAAGAVIALWLLAIAWLVRQLR